MAELENIFENINRIIWGPLGVICILSAGVLITFRLRFFQVTHLFHWLSSTVGSLFKKRRKKQREKGPISQFGAVCTTLAATIGTGNITGVAGAIAVGGTGAVFWMWVSAFFGMMTAFSENLLGIYFREKAKNGEWSGGAMYYLKHGIKFKPIAKLSAVAFAAFSVLASFGIGNLAQANTIAENMDKVFGISPFLTGVVITAISAAVILGGVNRVSAVTEKLVPFMAGFYMLGCIIIMVMNADMLADALFSVVKFAFTPRAGAGGAVGIAIKMGFRRGVFSNEAGLGSAVTVNASADTREPAVQGMWGIFEVFFDTVVVCTVTAAVILTSGLVDLSKGTLKVNYGNGAALAAESFSLFFGRFGGVFVAIAILFFAVATILAWSVNGAKSFSYLFGERLAPVYKTVYVGVVFIGSVIPDPSLAWSVSDTFNGLMMIPNLIGLFALSGLTVRITENYISRKIKHEKIRPLLSYHKEIQYQHEAEEMLELL